MVKTTKRHDLDSIYSLLLWDIMWLCPDASVYPHWVFNLFEFVVYRDFL